MQLQSINSLELKPGCRSLNKNNKISYGDNLKDYNSNFGLYSSDRKLLISFKGSKKNEQLSPKELAMYREMLEEHRNNGGQIFTNDDEINCFFNDEILTKTNAPYLKTLLNAKNDKGNPRVLCWQFMAQTLIEITKTNAPYFETLLNARDDKGNLRFFITAIATALRNLNEISIPYLKPLLDARDDEGNLRFNGKDIAVILGDINEISIPYLETLLDARDDEDNLRFNGEELVIILNAIKE